MKATISKTFTFEAAHFLPNVPESHQCRRMHGHSYRVVVYLSGEVDPEFGWVQDFADVTEAWKKWCLPWTDHRELNAYIENPTAENLAATFAVDLSEALSRLTRVEVWETATSMAAVDLA